MISTYLKFHLNKLEKWKQTKYKVSIRNEKIKIRAETNKIDNRKTTEKINKTEKQQNWQTFS